MDSLDFPPGVAVPVDEVDPDQSESRSYGMRRSARMLRRIRVHGDLQRERFIVPLQMVGGKLPIQAPTLPRGMQPFRSGQTERRQLHATAGARFQG